MGNCWRTAPGVQPGFPPGDLCVPVGCPCLLHQGSARGQRRRQKHQLAPAANSNRPAMSESPNIDLPRLSCHFCSSVTKRGHMSTRVTSYYGAWSPVVPPRDLDGCSRAEGGGRRAALATQRTAEGPHALHRPPALKAIERHFIFPSTIPLTSTQDATCSPRWIKTQQTHDFLLPLGSHTVPGGPSLHSAVKCTIQYINQTLSH